MPPKRKAVILPSNNTVRDISKKSWKIGKRIGIGGFGEVFVCQEDVGKAVSPSASYVIKIEPSGSGPLFVEMHFYMRTANKSSLDAWISQKKLDYLGMPTLHAKGQYEVDGTTYRYIIIDRYSSDLEAYIKNGKLPLKTAYTVGIRVLDVLEYIHSNGYIHADIKASNIMLGLTDKNKVYICDFGLACKFTRDEVHKQEKGDKKKMHNGTIEYTSRDAHKGMDSRRADIEILGYNLLHWLSGKLPWLGLLNDCKAVAESKEKFMADVTGLVSACFGKSGNKAIEAFLKSVAKIGFQDEPDYKALRKILVKGLEAAGKKFDRKLDLFSDRKRQSDETLFSSEDSEDEPPKKPPLKGLKQESKRKAPAKKKTKIQESDTETETTESISVQENLTPAMKHVLELKKKREAEKDAKKTKRAPRTRRKSPRKP
ncbi:serine/threonine-protein kinase VRK1 [Galendromus occidentalis]|uniref:non-specific serine/threonine protein kinase n=1 Tax=Galendromus occidentalis TaxID=34638 RepID=A0AAJ6QTN5_9ACAR|nr:serine/threonine-protein kinase VRK1 [Galendromus occidentalis]